jgi:hypothetical protein
MLPFDPFMCWKNKHAWADVSGTKQSVTTCRPNCREAKVLNMTLVIAIIATVPDLLM